MHDVSCLRAYILYISCGCFHRGRTRSSNSPTKDVDGDHYLRLQPRINDVEPYQAISVSSLTPTDDVDKDGYLRPNPGYAESHQAISRSAHIPTDSTPSSSDYCYVTPPSLQQQIRQPPVTGRDAGTLDSHGYLALH